MKNNNNKNHTNKNTTNKPDYGITSTEALFMLKQIVHREIKELSDKHENKEISKDEAMEAVEKFSKSLKTIAKIENDIIKTKIAQADYRKDNPDLQVSEREKEQIKEFVEKILINPELIKENAHNPEKLTKSLHEIVCDFVIRATNPQ